MSYRLLAVFLLFVFNLSAQKFSCGFEGEEAHLIKLNASKLRALEDGTLYECPIVFTIPYEEYLLFDQDEQAIKRFLYEKFDFVNALYLQSANTQFRITGIFIAKSAEDNRQMAAYWNSFWQDSILPLCKVFLT